MMCFKKGYAFSLIGAALVFSFGCSSYPLSDAAIHNNIANARALVEKGTDPNQYDRWGWTPLLWAVYYGNYEIAEYLLSHKADPNAVTKKEYGSILKGSTPLIIASYYGHTQLVKLMLAHGADTSIADSRGFTALSYARSYNHEGVIELLVKGK